jgi:hypothetical protein
MTEQKPYRVETTVDGTVDEVWHHLTVPDRVREWFGWDYAGIDGEIRQIFVDEADLDPPRRITFPDGSYLELEADGPRTVIRAVLPGPLDEARWDEIYDGMEEGWRTFFEQLRFLLTTRPAGKRRTIYLTGEIAPAALVKLLPNTGVWHDSRYQRMAVDPDGHLIGLAAQQPLTGAGMSDDQAGGPASVTVTSYGLDDEAFAALRERWSGRWSAVAKNAEVTP